MFQTGSEKRAAHGVSLFLVDADTPGFHKGRKLNKLGLKGQDTAELFFEDVRVPASALLGQVSQTKFGDFFYIFPPSCDGFKMCLFVISNMSSSESKSLELAVAKK